MNYHHFLGNSVQRICHVTGCRHNTYDCFSTGSQNQTYKQVSHCERFINFVFRLNLNKCHYVLIICKVLKKRTCNWFIKWLLICLFQITKPNVRRNVWCWCILHIIMLLHGYTTWYPFHMQLAVKVALNGTSPLGVILLVLN